MIILSRAHLSEEVAHELIVVRHNLALEVHALLAAHDPDEVARHSAPLVDELVERVLPVGARLPKVNLTWRGREGRGGEGGQQ